MSCIILLAWGMWINHLDIYRINVFYYKKIVNSKNVM